MNVSCYHLLSSRAYQLNLLKWCTDLEVEPVLEVWADLYLNGYITPPDVGPEAELQPYVDDAMNELGFLTGDISTKYGALRASLGYLQPWKINIVEVGNEENLGGGKIHISLTVGPLSPYQSSIL